MRSLSCFGTTGISRRLSCNLTAIISAMNRLALVIFFVVILTALKASEDLKTTSFAGTPPAWSNASGKDQYGNWAELTVAGVTQRFRWVAPGTFMMGSSSAEKTVALQSGAAISSVNDETPHLVTLTKGYWLADSACTQGLWLAIVGVNPAAFKESLENPVEMVSRDDCEDFLGKLNAKIPGAKFRFPSEAEWEFACRAGTTTPYSFGETITPAQVNYDGNHPFGTGQKGLFRQKTVSVKSLPPNPWGLYEMHGNVWQWCSDWYGDYPSGAVSDPNGPPSGLGRVVRGGGRRNSAWHCRSASRSGSGPSYRNSSLGFRLAAQASP